MRARLRLAFKRYFPSGHQESLRSRVCEFGKEAKRGVFEDDEMLGYLHDIHPDVFAIIAEYGVDYVPYAFRKPPPYGEPEVAQCYLNSLKLAQQLNTSLDVRPRRKNRTPFVYVEGIAMGPIVYPMAHAWIARGLTGNRALDWTLYATCRWTRYIGIPFTLTEHRELMHLTRRGNLFDRNHFTAKAKKRLIEILEARKEGGEKSIDTI